MISDFEYYHGSVITRLIHGNGMPLEISTYKSEDNATYTINGSTGIYIKYSKKRMSPWRFTFKEVHQNEIRLMKESLSEVFLVLVCHDDGIVALSFHELKRILNDFHDEYEWVSLARAKRQEYSVKGSDGKLQWKIARNEFPAKIVNYLHS